MFETILLSLSALASPFSISVTEAFLILTILFAGYTLYREKDFSVFKQPFAKFFLLMFFAEILSTFFGYNPAESIKSIASMWTMLFLFSVYILYDGKNRERFFILFLTVLIVSVFYTASKFVPHTYFRGSGFYSQPLTYGNVLCIGLVAALGFLMFTPHQTLKIRLFFYISILFCFIGLVLSGDRGPMLYAFITVIAMIVYRFKMKGVAIAVAVSVICATVAFSTPIIKSRFISIKTEIDNGSNTSAGTRLVLWKAVTKAIAQRPVFGYGKGNFKPVISKLIDVPVLSIAHAHNSYLQYTFVNGFFGLIALLLFLGSLVMTIIKQMKTNPYAKTALFILIVYMLEGLTENNFRDSEVVMAAYMTIALLITPVKEKAFHIFSKG